MFEQITAQKDKRSSLRKSLCFLGGCVTLAIFVMALVLVPKLWPEVIPPHILVKRALLLSSLRTGNPVPPHTEIVGVQKGNGPTVNSRRPFLPPLMTEPPRVPANSPSAEPPQFGPSPVLADVPPGAGPYCPGCVPGPPCPGCIGTDPGFMAPPPPPPPAKPKELEPKAPEQFRLIRIGGNVQAARLVRQLRPAYPPLAKASHVQGVVRLVAIISREGTIQHLEVLSGHPLLIPAAIEAVKQWVYQPTFLNGEPVEVQTQIDVNFTLSQ